LCEAFALSGARGIRCLHENPGEIALSETGGAESGALATTSDPDLLLIVGRWSMLPESIRRAVLALVKTTVEE
jgi:hypothetical protein